MRGKSKCGNIPAAGRRPKLVLSALLAFAAAPLQTFAVVSMTTPLASTGTTVITSQRLEFNNRERQAVFEGDVVVKDETLQISADRILVVFDEEEAPKRLEASGNVVIEQDNLVSRSQSAVYDVEAARMVLQGSAVVQRGRDLLKGETITFWRDEDRIEVVPGMLVISPQGTGASPVIQ